MKMVINKKPIIVCPRFNENVSACRVCHHGIVGHRYETSCRDGRCRLFIEEMITCVEFSGDRER